MLRPDPVQRPRLLEMRDNLQARIAEAEREGWLGEVEGLRVSLAGAEDKINKLDHLTGRRATVHLGAPVILHQVIGRTDQPAAQMAAVEVVDG
jgi:hypothetical protein